jgi:hypothetical protein
VSNLLRISLIGRALDAAEEQFVLRVYERALRRDFAEPSLTVRINFRGKGGSTSMEPFVNGKALDAMLFHGKRRRRAVDSVRALVAVALLYSPAVEVLFAFEPDSREAKRVEASFSEFVSAPLELGSLYAIAATPSWFLVSGVEARRLKPEAGRGRYHRSFWIKTVNQAMAMPVVEELVSADGALVVDEGTTLPHDPPAERRRADANIIAGDRIYFEL